MRILLIKMSSMGDVFHAFPALSDAQANIPDLTVDWVVEKAFAEIPSWHPVVDKVYPIELRRWRKTPFSSKTRSEIKTFFEEINRTQYDLVLDAQGLYKSLWVAKKVEAPIYGMDFSSVREPLVSLFYNHKIHVGKAQHAITRLRELFSKALNYSISPNSSIAYGLNTSDWKRPELPWQSEPYMVFLHGTTWDTKCWPEEYWRELLHKICQVGYKVILPWGSKEEQERSYRLQQGCEGCTWVPEQLLSLNDIARILKFSKAVASVDTGLSHVATALDVPMVVLYRVTDPKLVGALGESVCHLVSPEAENYVKSFRDAQQQEASLKGLDVDTVFQALDGMVSHE
ncbi:lipopolysaccharide heptosyltransferase I [Hydrogenovibrio marinus]|uniref:Lipopolysaccharide heptosyltransferase 1 n=1 Tax=Hydrogenovibrio marinus TaxID=28885 RepID=A0A066ZWH7_HYDMR|nr:lipopolysaccharide heptosyltransferase I [Hydrogenovibrio marinus]KDN96629.1 ADP-heptose--LPS heptosyltransferase [Hydrogenovibrio marinus]BBN60160.1 ADP-heptose--LPS heptosyltransferase [Hydrogenovibrio marinus]